MVTDTNAAYEPEVNLMCIGCKKKPEEIQEYVEAAKAEGVTPQQYVLSEEGTFNKRNGHFLCTDDFIKAEEVAGHRLIGSSGQSWIAP